MSSAGVAASLCRRIWNVVPSARLADAGMSLSRCAAELYESTAASKPLRSFTIWMASCRVEDGGGSQGSMLWARASAWMPTSRASHL